MALRPWVNQVQGFFDDISKSLGLKNTWQRGKRGQYCVTSFMDDPK